MFVFEWAERKFMNKDKEKNEMREEYDFRGKQGVRGKYYEAMRKGYKTIIHKSDGTTEETETRPIFLRRRCSGILSRFKIGQRSLARFNRTCVGKKDLVYILLKNIL